MRAAIGRLRPQSALGWSALAVGFAFLVYGLSSATGASPPYVLAGFVAVGWVASVRWIYGLARGNRRGGSRGSGVDADGASDPERRSDEPEPEFEGAHRE